MKFFIILLFVFTNCHASDSIRFIVPQSIGGSTDVAARILGKNLNTNTIVHNKPGAGSVTGIEYAKRQTPNGNNFLVVASSFTLNTVFAPITAYDPINDFIPIKQFVELPNVIVVSTNSNIRTIKDITQNESLIFGHSGIGTSSYVAMKLFMSTVNKKYLLVPYKGGAPAIQSILTKETDVNFAALSSALPLIRTNQIRPIAITSTKRIHDIPTLSEVGIPNLKYMAWIGILAPQNTSKKIIDDMEKQINGVLSKTSVVQEFQHHGMEVINQSRKEFSDNIKYEIKKWKSLDGL